MIKSILVPLVGRELDEISLETAYSIGHLFDAHIDCLHVREHPAEVAARISPFDGGRMLLSRTIWDMLEQDATKCETASREVFQNFMVRRNIAAVEAPPPSPGRMSISYRVVAGDFAKRTVDASHTRDLVVLAREENSSPLSLEEFADVLVGSGKPLLVGCQNIPTGNGGSTVAVAWKETAEAARAVTAAMPLLEKMSRAIVICGADKGLDAQAATESASRLATELRWHGIECETRCVMPSEDQPASLLDAIVHSGANLLVMGGYGHSRIREFVFGGFTQRVLTSCRIPVFMLH